MHILLLVAFVVIAFKKVWLIHSPVILAEVAVVYLTFLIYIRHDICISLPMSHNAFNYNTNIEVDIPDSFDTEQNYMCNEGDIRGVQNSTAEDEGALVDNRFVEEAVVDTFVEDIRCILDIEEVWEAEEHKVAVDLESYQY